ncbi:MAG TPA: Mur ligase family protein [Opitutus sp.]|nr:Mur ligase family protein [Opitutus sp.]
MNGGRKLWRVGRALFSAEGREFLVRRTYDPWQAWYFAVARLHRRTVGRQRRIVVVVGTYGKTTTTRAVLRALGLPPRDAAANDNYSGMIALTYLRTPRVQRTAVIEIGIARPGQMAGWARALRPDVVVVTCIGDEHILSFRDREHIRDEKAEAVRCLGPHGVAVLNRDDPLVAGMAGMTRARVVWYGFDAASTYRGTNWTSGWPGPARLDYAAGENAGSIRCGFVARETAYALLAALAVAGATVQETARAAENLEGMEATPGRLDRRCTPGGVWIVRDDFKGNLQTYEVAFAAVRNLPGRLFLVLGGIAALPGPRRPGYRNLAKVVAGIFDEVIVVNNAWDIYAPELRRQSAAGARVSAFARARSRREVADILRRRCAPGDVVLIKGRTNEYLGEIADLLLRDAVSSPAEIGADTAVDGEAAESEMPAD